MVIPEIVGSAALPHLRLLRSIVWGLVYLAGLGALVAPPGGGMPAARVATPDTSRSCPPPPPVAERGLPAGIPGLVTVSSRGDVGSGSAGSAIVAVGGEAAASPSEPQPLPSPPPVGIAAVGAGRSVHGYVLHGDGVLDAFGDVPIVADRPAGGETPVDVSLGAAGAGGWVISAQGGVHGFGGRGDRAVGPGPGAVIAGDLTGSGDGYLLEADGRLRAVGAAPDRQIAGPVEAVDVAVRAGGDSGWVLAADGRLHGFGGAPQITLSPPAVLSSPARSHRAVVVAGSGRGGWVVTGDGQVLPFGGWRPGPPPISGTGAGTGPDAGSRAEIVDAAAVGPVRAPWSSAFGLCSATIGPQCYRCVTIDHLAGRPRPTPSPTTPSPTTPSPTTPSPSSQLHWIEPEDQAT